MTVTETYRAYRDDLLRLREDLDQARKSFSWPEIDHFNFTSDWFDQLAADPVRGDQPALIIANEAGVDISLTFRELAERAARVAVWFQSLGMGRGDKLMVMLDNQVELWEAMLAAIKLGVVVLPTTTMLAPQAIISRLERAQVRWAMTNTDNLDKFANCADQLDGLITTGEATDQAHGFTREATGELTDPGLTDAAETMLIYFTSGTTSEPKMVTHTQYSYAVGHFSTLYWMGLRPGDVHLNIASPGWGKHAWSSFFTPWIAEATILVFNYRRFDPEALMELMDRQQVTSLCVPPTVWRMLIQADLTQLSTPPTVALSAGEPLSASIIEHVRRDWGVDIRDGYGQTESTLQIANTPGQELTPGALGRPLPGYQVELMDQDTEDIISGPGEGQVVLRLDPRPGGLTPGYYRDDERNAEAFSQGVYRTGDVMKRDESGVYTYVSRADDLFKASDYKLSPFELESGLIQHPAVLEVAVVPSPDAIRMAVPKAYIVLAQGYEPTEETARSIYEFGRETLPPYGRVRRFQFSQLPKTISGKIRRVQLRRQEQELHGDDGQKTPPVVTEGFDVEFAEAQLRS
ncbi:AMP-binding protein [Auritidibacter sp. NML100628]|uniref:AMP-binding protein n=1 Tax=Auritidibacter sp. NML100628 TaxID=2170742 RepID=UPI000D73663E|nr:AMP-binding protein [Auritidibacter sp. NML100628]PXA77227.1 AMP-dependent synthetase [Auritidibacter sp. NML100628]